MLAQVSRTSKDFRKLGGILQRARAVAPRLVDRNALQPLWGWTKHKHLSVSLPFSVSFSLSFSVSLYLLLSRLCLCLYISISRSSAIPVSFSVSLCAVASSVRCPPASTCPSLVPLFRFSNCLSSFFGGCAFIHHSHNYHSTPKRFLQSTKGWRWTRGIGRERDEKTDSGKVSNSLPSLLSTWSFFLSLACSLFTSFLYSFHFALLRLLF